MLDQGRAGLGRSAGALRLPIDRATAVACALTAASCADSYGGLFSHAYPGDTSLYQRYGSEIVHLHEWPYHVFFVEYPPGALPVFVLPELVSGAHYLIVFKLWMTACAVGFTACAGWICRRLSLGALRLAPAVLAPVLLGPVFLNRFDPIVALLTLLALVALLQGRARAGGALVAVGTAVKLYPLLTLPLALRRLRPRRALLVAFLVTSMVFWAPFLVVGAGGLRYSLTVQLERHLQSESLAASLLLAGSKLGIQHVGWVKGFGSIDIGGHPARVAGALSSVVSLLLVAAIVAAYWRGADEDGRLVTAFAGVVAAFVVFGKVLSPQYLIWLAPLVPLARGRRGLAAGGLLLAALALTMPEYLFWGRYGVREQNWTVWLLLLRNGLLVAMFVLLALELRPRARPRPEAVGQV